MKYNLITVKRLTGIALFVFSFLWFYFPGEYVMIANQDLTLFLKTPGYLFSFLDRPGGLLEYLGSFLSQFLRFRMTGALLLSGMITIIFFIADGLIKKITGRKGFWLFGALTAILILGMQNYYPHQVSHTLGFILAMGLATTIPGTGIRKWVFLAIIVPLIYLVGGGYVWIFCGLVMVEDVMRTRKMDLVPVLFTTVYPALLILAASALILLDPLKELVIIQLPFGKEYGESPWPYLFMGWMFLGIVLSEVPHPLKNLKPVWKMLSETALCLAALTLVLHFSYHRKNAEFFHIEKLAISEDWDGLLQYTEQHPSTNLFGSFYTNLALVNRGRLCKDLFRYPQPFGRRGLCFEWDAKGEILRRGSDFFWAIHFVNEAHHWAFESMIIDGFTRRNLKRLIETELVSGNDKTAEKYIDLLGRSLFQKKLAGHYRSFLNNRTAIENDPELGPTMKFHMNQDFFSEGLDLEKNLRMLLTSNPANRPAYDYLMALLLLEKEVDKMTELLPDYFETFKGPLPVLLDESLLVYKITHKENHLTNINVSPSTLKRFEEYTRILRQYRDPGDAARMLFPSFQHSFWFYLNFSTLTVGKP
jgi:hypothetical protein